MKLGWLALAGVIGLSACQRTPPSPPLVSVNGEVITAEALDLEVRLAGPMGPNPAAQLEELIDQALILQEGRRLGITLSQDALAAAEAFARAGTDDETLDATLSERGVSLKEWKTRLAQTALADEVVRQAVRNKLDVGRQEIQDYYWEHLPAFRRGQRRVYRQVFSAKRAGADAALAELQLGGKFEEVAKRRGEGPEANDGGLLGAEGRNQWPQALAAAAQKLKLHEFSPVLKSPWGWHVLYLEAIEKEQGESLDQAAPKARAKLMKEKELVLYQLWLEHLREQAKIERLSAQTTPTKATKAAK